MVEWRPLADGVLIRRYDELDLTVAAVLGDRSVLVIDTRGDEEQGKELAGAVRAITDLPWQLVVTHGHFDHCFGSAAFGPVPIWAHERCLPFLRATAERQRAQWIEHYRATAPERSSALAETVVPPPTHPVRRPVEVDLGGRCVRLLPLGAGHTDHDLVVRVPDAGIVFAGDVVEDGTPDFEDARPAQWPSAVDELLRLGEEVIVPGHGEPVGREFVQTQQRELAAVAALYDAVRGGRLTEDVALAHSPYPEDTTRTALRGSP